ncbi:polysaccharide deacetylase family protein [Spongisporangium articulatum]|uniref:Polysaccharide deacetylase family protein n=1 Tax=Spongisporangium articulatum TaxID=3362603 RepID=A0ABW8ANZ8_9ACTN
MSIETHRERWSYSALPGRPRGTWPNGARLAVVVCVGVESYRFGEGLTEDVLPGTPAPDLVNTAWRDYGNRVGAFRLFDRLAALGVRPTVLLNTDVYAQAPDVPAAARRAGAEFVGHGLSNSDSLSGRHEDDERGYLAAVAEAIRGQEGAAPRGWSSPWLAHTPNTVDLLAETGYRYLLDLRLDDQPVWLTTRSGPLLAIPYAAELNDSSTMIGRSLSAPEFARMIEDEAAELHTAAAEHPLVLSVVLHSFISGAPFRLRPVMRALEAVAALPDVWLTTPGEIYDAVVASPALFPAPEEVSR